MPAARLCCDESPDVLLEVAVLSTWRERLRGLLGTGPDAGPVMLALCSSVHTFGMRYSLDVAFVGDDQEHEFYPADSAKAKNVLPEDRVNLPDRRIAEAWGRAAQ